MHALDAFLLTLFEKYADLLKKGFSDDFQEVRHILVNKHSGDVNTCLDCFHR